jgi:hypothetical protein
MSSTRTPVLGMPIDAPGFWAHVLSSNSFASRGYLWGFAKGIHYCIVNPERLDVGVFRRQSHFKPWFTSTAAGRNAPVVTNAPQMRLIGDLQFGTVLVLLVASVVTGAAIGAVVGALVGSFFTAIGSIIGGAFGLLVGTLGTFFGTLALLGHTATPFGSVVPIPPGERQPTPHTHSWHFGRTGTGFTAYAIGPGEPTGLQVGSGGLTGLVANGAPLGKQATGAGRIYTRLMRTGPDLVSWGLRPWDLNTDPELREAADLQAPAYGQSVPTNGVLVVAGTDVWTPTTTATLIRAGVTDAVAMDGNDFAVMGGGDDLVIETSTFSDWLVRYGFEAV